jgi:hypothetical protein
MTEDEYQAKLFALWRDTYALKEAVVMSRVGVQPDFNAGMLEAAALILESEIADGDALELAQKEFRDKRLLWALEGTP